MSDKKPSSNTLRVLFYGAVLGSAATLAIPAAFHAGMTSYRDHDEMRHLRMTVTALSPPRQGEPPHVMTAIGIEYDVINVPDRGVNTANDVWRQMRVGCTYNISAFGYRTRDLGINPVIQEAKLFPTPECPALPPRA